MCRREDQNRHYYLYFGASFDEKSLTKHRVFAQSLLTDAHPRRSHQIHAPQHHVSQMPSGYKFLVCIMVPSAEELCAVEKMAAQSTGNKKVTQTLGVPLRTTKQWLPQTRTTHLPTQNGLPVSVSSVHFSLNKKHIIQSIRLKQRACWVDSLGVSNDVRILKLSSFTTQKVAQTKKKAISRNHMIRNPPNSPKQTHFDRQVPQRSPVRVSEGAPRGAELASTL